MTFALFCLALFWLVAVIFFWAIVDAGAEQEARQSEAEAREKARRR